MYSEIISSLSGTRLLKWQRFLEKSHLVPDALVDKTVILWDDDKIAATGSRYNNILKLIAVDESYRGEDLTSRVIGELRRDAFNEGHRGLFLYTKPQNKSIFSSLFFYPIAETGDIVLLEDKKDGIKSFIDSLPHVVASGRVGSIVMNCNPFTLGHQYLIETAASECEHLFVFVLSEDKSEFSAQDRFEMVQLGTRHLANVTVVPTGPYLISSATFPTYFLKDRDTVTEAQSHLDIEVFAKHYAPALGITRRYVGSEPISALTNAYNKELKTYLPQKGIEVIEIQRKSCGGSAISASRVRENISNGEFKTLSDLLPKTSIDFLTAKGYIQ